MSICLNITFKDTRHDLKVTLIDSHTVKPKILTRGYRLSGELYHTLGSEFMMTQNKNSFALVTYVSKFFFSILFNYDE